MTLGTALLAGIVGAVSSAINAVAGGGSLVSFPVLRVGFGMPSVAANMTNTSSLWPGSLAGAFGYSNLLAKTKHHLRALIFSTLLGSTLGAWMLTVTSPHLFDVLVPILILFAATLLTLQPRIKAWAGRKHEGVPHAVGFVLQFFVAMYGGYFGAGMGIMMLAAFSLYVEGDIHEYNALKNWLGLIINFMATLVFVLPGKGANHPRIDWSIAAPMIVGSILGGYAMARLSQRIDSEKLRVVIAAYGFIAAGYFVYHLFSGG
ncbi:MAG TPA: sulfite exporter TauE/SafE family protein [Fimbriimonadaceae bacterium]|nr:sulfite exporter TauE/SafE family protein [Fimbriimonadaceae bacterium]